MRKLDALCGTHKLMRDQGAEGWRELKSAPQGERSGHRDCKGPTGGLAGLSQLRSACLSTVLPFTSERMTACAPEVFSLSHRAKVGWVLYVRGCWGVGAEQLIRQRAVGLVALAILRPSRHMLRLEAAFIPVP